MADASGTPTSPDNIPTYNTGVDPPSGKGFNTAMAQIQAIITNLKAGTLASGKILASALSGIIPTANLGSGSASSTTFLRGDQTWAAPTSGLVLLWDSVDSGVTLPATSFTTPALAQTYKNLHIDFSGRGDFAGNDIDVGVRFNGDTAGNYDTVIVFNNSSTTSAAVQEISQTSINMFTITGATASANMAGLASLRLINYAATVFHKMILGNDGRFDDGAGTTFKAAQRVGRWRNTAAVSTITFFPRQGTNFIAGTRVTVYGEA